MNLKRVAFFLTIGTEWFEAVGINCDVVLLDGVPHAKVLQVR